VQMRRSCAVCRRPGLGRRYCWDTYTCVAIYFVPASAPPLSGGAMPGGWRGPLRGGGRGAKRLAAHPVGLFDLWGVTGEGFRICS
jgi:hypothetical protein